jgi:hypothetical protein
LLEALAAISAFAARVNHATHANAVADLLEKIVTFRIGVA